MHMHKLRLLNSTRQASNVTLADVIHPLTPALMLHLLWKLETSTENHRSTLASQTFSIKLTPAMCKGMSTKFVPCLLLLLARQRDVYRTETCYCSAFILNTEFSLNLPMVN